MDRNDAISIAHSNGAFVVPRKGDVDRNGSRPSCAAVIIVVPRKGDVDRNSTTPFDDARYVVVPRKGDVDRNYTVVELSDDPYRRPPQGGRG